MLLLSVNVNGKNQPYADNSDYHIIEQIKVDVKLFTLLDKDTSLKSNVMKNKKEVVITTPEMSSTDKLLVEIRDSLRK